MKPNNTSESPLANSRILRTHVNRYEEFPNPKQLIRSTHEHIALYTTGIAFVLQMLICILFLIRGLSGNAHSLILGILILIWVAVFDAVLISASMRK